MIKKINLLLGVVIFALVFFVKLPQKNLVCAQSYMSRCGGCSGPGSWCVEAGNGYSCGSGASCQGSFKGSTAYCPPGCSCSAIGYTGGNTSCANNCVHVDSCQSAPPPPPPPPGQPPAPPGACAPCSDWCNTASECSSVGGTWGVPLCSYAYCTPSSLRGCAVCSSSPPPPPPPPPPPSCNNFTLTLGPPASPIEAGNSTVLNSTVSVSNADSWNIVFWSDNSNIARTEKVTALRANVYGEGGGSTTLRARLTAVSSGGSCQLDRAVPITVNAAPWWQVQDGDVVSGGDLLSKIPVTCLLPGCRPYFDLKGQGNYPGLPIYGSASGSGTADFSAAGTETGVPSEGEYWLAKSPYNATANLIDYNYFIRQIPSDVTIYDIDGDIQTGELTSQGKTQTRGFVWFRVKGDAHINGNINIVGSNRIVLLVEGGDFYVTKDITIQTPGSGFFMAIVGKSGVNKGNIYLSAGKTTSTPTPQPAPVINNEPPGSNRSCGQSCGYYACGPLPWPPGANCLCDGDGDPGTNAPSACRYLNTSYCAGGASAATYCAPIGGPPGWSTPNCTNLDIYNGYIDKSVAPGPQFPTVPELQAACASMVVVPTPPPVIDNGRVSDLDGIYFAEGQFFTGSASAKDDESLTVRGSIAAMGGIVLQRDLGNAGNINTPSELFIYSPQLLSTFPREFFRDKIVWQEVAP